MQSSGTMAICFPEVASPPLTTPVPVPTILVFGVEPDFLGSMILAGWWEDMAPHPLGSHMASRIREGFLLFPHPARRHAPKGQQDRYPCPWN
jgi:hypothetical protein